MKKYFVFLLLAALPLNSQAFTLNSQSNSGFKGWQNPELTFNVNPANCPAGMDIPALIEEAVAVWNNVPTSRIKISYNAATTSTTHANPTTVYCEPNFEAVTGADDDYVPAAASLLPSGNYAVGGLLYLNVSGGQANLSNYNRTLLLVIIAHEVGHILGLGHSQDAHALMYYNAGGKAHLTLGQDDIDGVSYLYPRDELSGDQPLGCGLISALLPPKPPSGGLLAILALLLALPLAIYLRLRIYETD